MASDTESRFDGGGLDFHAKFLGSAKVEKSKGTEVCQEAMQRLLQELRNRKEPKQRLVINLSFEGTRLKEMPPGVNLMDVMMKHTEVSFVWKDPRDQRSLGIIRCEQDEADKEEKKYVFYGLRTIKAAMPFLQEMQQLFQIVKNRADDAKAAKAEAGEAEQSKEAKEETKKEETPKVEESKESKESKEENRDRAVSNLLKMDNRELPQSDSVASLDELTDIFSGSAAVASTTTADSANPFGDSTPFGQLSQPPAQNSLFGQPAAQSNVFGQTANPFGQQNSQFGQPPAQNSQFGQPPAQNSQFGQQNSQFGQPPAQNSQFGQPPTSQFSSNPFSAGAQWNQQQQYQYQQQQQQQQQSSANPFASVFDGQNSVPSDSVLQPESLAPKKPGTPDPMQPDAFSDLVLGLKSDARRQQQSGKDLFKAERPKTTLKELANQASRPQ